MLRVDIKNTGVARVASFDLLKFLGMFLVIWGHIIAALSSEDFHTNGCFLFIYSFHMPLFMVISGFFFAKNAFNRSFLDVIKNKFRQLMLPAIIWGAIIASLSLLNHIYSGHSELHIKFANSMFLSVWFLKCLFLCCLLGRLTNNTIGGGIISVCLCQFLPILKIEVMYPCFVFGFLLNRYYCKIMQHSSVFLPFFLILFSLCYFLYSNIILNYMQTDTMGILNTLCYRFVRIVVGVVGSTFLILLFGKTFNSENSDDKVYNKSGLRFIMAVGRETLGIYILQEIVIWGILSKIHGLRLFDGFFLSIVVTPVLSMLLMWLCLSIVRLFKTNEKVAFYLFGVVRR